MSSEGIGKMKMTQRLSIYTLLVLKKGMIIYGYRDKSARDSWNHLTHVISPILTRWTIAKCSHACVSHLIFKFWIQVMEKCFDQHNTTQKYKAKNYKQHGKQWYIIKSQSFNKISGSIRNLTWSPYKTPWINVTNTKQLVKTKWAQMVQT